MSLLSLGGILMLPLIVCSVLLIGVSIERWIKLRRHQKDTLAFCNEARPLIETRNWEELELLCRQSSLPVARILGRGVRYRKTTASAVQRAMEEQAEQEVPLLSRRLGVLSGIAHLGPLLGLLGTIFGMIAAFRKIETISEAGVAVDAGLLASGIWEALITTAAGLLLAIPAYILYRYFQAKLDDQVALIETTARMLVDEFVTARPSGYGNRAIVA
jgi:biopolymer transport protein ExbB